MKDRVLSRLFSVGCLAVCASTALATLSKTGVGVAQLEWVDDAVEEFMEDNDISAGIVGVMKDGCIIYQRGFGQKGVTWPISLPISIPIPENAIMRVASCTKPFTAAAIRKLEADGSLSLCDYVYDLGQVNTCTTRVHDRGILTVHPLNDTLGDEDHKKVTVQNCLEHKAGWNRDVKPVGNCLGNECDMADDLGIDSPPGVDKEIDWLLGQYLYYEPGTTQAYANEGYLVLGKIVEALSGMDLFDFHRTRVLTPDMWVPATDLIQARTFYAYPREATYDSAGHEGRCISVAECTSPCDTAHLVSSPYGGWDQESYKGFGGVLASAATMLELAERYYLQGLDPNIGLPLVSRKSGAHGGTLTGTNTLVVQRKSDAVNVFIFFNKEDGTTEFHYANDFYNWVLGPALDAQSVWPTTCVGGFWVDPAGTASSVYGSYDRPFGGLDDALAYLADGSRLNFKPGVSGWTGTIATKLLLSAPLGSAVLGVAH